MKREKGSSNNIFIRLLNFFESDFNRVFGEKNNFYYYLGALPTLMLIILFLSGIYLFIYYSISVDTTYESIKYIMTEAPLGAQIRSLHRYAADAMVFFTGLHMFRLIFEGKFKNHRKLAWITGVIMLFIILVQGITGYIMPLDGTARFLMEKTSEILASLRIAGDTLPRSFSSTAFLGKWIMWVILIIHLAIPMMLVVFLFIHIKRVSRAKLFLPQPLYVGFSIFMVLFSFIFTVKLIEPADAEFLPYLVQMDWFFNFLAPFMEKDFHPLLLFFLFIGTTALIGALPWIGGKEKVEYSVRDLSKCRGCSICARDCPYHAIHMRQRTDKGNYKLEAVVDENICSGCGVCVGSCDFGSISLLDRSLDDIKNEIKNAVKRDKTGKKWIGAICRHKRSLFSENASGEVEGLPGIQLIDVPCVGMLGTSLLKMSQEAGAKGLLVGACPTGDCKFREGNETFHERMEGKRKPELAKANTDFPIVSLRFNRADAGEFIKEASQKMAQYSEQSKGAGAKVRIYSFLNFTNRTLPAIRSVLAICLFVVLFYLGAASDIGTFPLDKSKFLFRVDFFHLTANKSCNIGEIPASEYEKAAARMGGTIKLDELSKEARERILEAARENVREKLCSRERLPVELQFLVDGKLIYKKLYQPGGIQKDGLTYVLYKGYLKPGEQTIQIIATEIDGEKSLKEFKFEKRDVYEGGSVYFVDFEPNENKLYLRTGKREF